MDRLPLVPVVLAGGSGTRLWPLSRLDAPKQMLPLLGSKTMLRMTIERTAEIAGRQPATVVCNAAYADLVRTELDAAGDERGRIVVEPVGRNTAPAVAAAAAMLAPEGDCLLLVMPADHLISDVGAFTAGIAAGCEAAQAGELVTFGITATYPATGYGYIRSSGSGAVRPVAAFVEKPDRATAERFLETGEYFWNSGMFLFRAERYLDELERYAPEIAGAAQRAVAAGRVDESGVLHLDTEAFAASPSISIDYAVMEHTAAAAVVPLDAGWSDIGSWASLFDATEVDDAGNALIGDVVVQDAANTYVRSDGPLVAAAHVDDLIVVATPDAVLVTDRHHSETVRDLVGRMRAGHRSEADTSAAQVRPWGRLVMLSRTTGHRVERLDVNPRRTVDAAAGTWFVLDGTAERNGARVEAGDVVAISTTEAPSDFRNVADAPLVLLAVTARGAER